MWLEPIAIGRLAQMVQSPGAYIERRIEDLEVFHDQYFRVAVREQVAVPSHGRSSGSGPSPAYVPVGWYSKARLPSLEVRDDAGRALALMPQAPRATVLAVIILNRWLPIYWESIPWSGPGSPDERLAWDQIVAGVGQVAVCDVQESRETFEDLRRQLREMAQGHFPLDKHAQYRVGRLAYNDVFWTEVRSWIDTTLLITRVEANAGSVQSLTITYSERFPHDPVASGGRLTSLLQYLGVVSTPIVRKVANLGRADSLYITARVPEGIEPVRFYWSWLADVPGWWDPDGISSEVAALSWRLDQLPLSIGPPADQVEDDPFGGELAATLEVQLGPSDGLWMAVLVTGFLLAVSTFIYQQAHDIQKAADRTTLVAVAGAFSGLPAALTGAIAFRAAPFGRRISRLPRALLATLSAVMAVLAAVVSVRQFSGRATATTAYVASVYAFFLSGILVYLGGGMRYRHNTRSRHTKKTMRMSPAACRRAQVRWSTAALSSWALMSILFARAQFHLRAAHFFTKHFPGNVVHAIVSWF